MGEFYNGHECGAKARPVPESESEARDDGHAPAGHQAASLTRQELILKIRQEMVENPFLEDVQAEEEGYDVVPEWEKRGHGPDRFIVGVRSG